MPTAHWGVIASSGRAVLRGQRRPWLTRVAGTALLAATAALFFSSTTATRHGSPTVGCGSGWDVVAGRAGWRQWLADDLADTRLTARFVRTDACPGVVNAHLLVAAALAAAALLVLIAGEYLGRPAPTGPGGRHDSARRLRGFARAVTALGVALTAGGLTGLALLTADPTSPLFLYASRPAVWLCGCLLLLPAVLLIALGRAAHLLAGHLSEVGREPS